MKTGEGKTLVATLPLYLNALAGVNVHLVTVNDYLARRDAEWMGPVYEALGITRRHHPVRDARRLRADQPPGRLRLRHHLRHELRVRLRLPARQHGGRARPRPSSAATGYAIVDEVDSILIDEARTPLIISGQPEQAADTYYSFASAVGDLELGTDYEVDEKLQHRRADRGRRDEGRARARRREPLRARERPAGEPPDPGDQGQGALQARRRVRGHGRRGQDRRRVHRPHHGGPALVGGPAPGGRGQGGRADPGGERHRRHRSRSRTTSACTRSSPA